MLRTFRLVPRVRYASGYTGKHIVSQEHRPIIQDMPPEGGYPEIQYESQNKSRGPPGWAIWLGGIAIVSYGFYMLGQTNIERNSWKKEKRKSPSFFLSVLHSLIVSPLQATPA